MVYEFVVCKLYMRWIQHRIGDSIPRDGPIKAFGFWAYLIFLIVSDIA